MGSRILKEQMAYEPIVGHRLPWDCISSRCSIVLWVRPLGQRLGIGVGGSRQETLDPGFVLLGTRQQGVPVILRELVLSGKFDLVSPNFTVRDVTTELSEPRSTLCRTEIQSQWIDHWVAINVD
ncbi:unnamed protein product [Schistosoma margrebowiei]|uniref:Uncharacterized protein n=1 Tax=Schistosoma margrebowiei TaxID=48269 RepID=A0A183MAG5_9TREM|nr:unnamed protein product [Schistosoma margrebowiei]